MSEKYYRITFEGRGYFTAVNDLLDYLGDQAYDEYDEVAHDEINYALSELEYRLYCPDIRNEEAIFAYTEEGYRKFHFLIEDLSKILSDYGFEALKIKELSPTEIIYRDNDQIAFVQ